MERQRAEMSRFVSAPAYITCLFCDLRGFTSFVETAEPEEHFEVLRAYHGGIGDLITTHGGRSSTSPATG